MPTPAEASFAALGESCLAPFFRLQAEIAPQQMMLLLRNLLRMPREIVQMLALLASLQEPQGQELLRKLLSEDVNVSPEQLQALFKEQAAECQDKLVKLLQSAHTEWTGSGQQMGDMMGAFSQVMARAGNSPADALHTLFNLYLPYYPLEEPRQFSLYFEQEDGGEEGSGEGRQLVLLIQTLSLGRFKIVLAMAGAGQEILIQHEPLQAPVLDALGERILGAFAGAGTQPPTLVFREQAGGSVKPLQPVRGSEVRQSVGLQPSGTLSTRTIYTAYLLIRVIFELDNLHGQRAGR